MNKPKADSGKKVMSRDAEENPLARDFRLFLETVVPAKYQVLRGLVVMLKSAFYGGAFCMSDYHPEKRKEALEELQRWQDEMVSDIEKMNMTGRVNH